MLPSTESNPDGYYESREINTLNNYIISEYLAGIRFRRWKSHLKTLNNSDFRAFPFSSISIPNNIKLCARTCNAIKYFCNKSEYCYKDPRLSVTLPAWQNYFSGDEKFIVVFREPEITISSYIRNGQRVYSPPLVFDGFELEEAYSLNYNKLIKMSSRNWLFVHYRQILQMDKNHELEAFAGRKLDWSHINPVLVRSKKTDYICKLKHVNCTYNELCRKAGYREL